MKVFIILVTLAYTVVARVTTDLVERLGLLDHRAKKDDLECLDFQVTLDLTAQKAAMVEKESQGRTALKDHLAFLVYQASVDLEELE